MKEIKLFSSRKIIINECQSFRKYMGKKVLSKSGKLVGKIFDVIAKENSIIGFIVTTKMSKIYVDKQYISIDSADALMLAIDPVIFLIGKQVFDSEGKKLGKVTEINRDNNLNSYSGIVVKKSVYSKAITIPPSEISMAKNNIILNKAY